MRNSRNKLGITAILALFVAIAVGTTASAEGVPPGSSGGGFLPLGDEWKTQTLSIESGPNGAEMVFLVRGSTAVSLDSTTVSSTDPWTLTVEDAGGWQNKGYMRRGDIGGEGWTYWLDDDYPLNNQFGVLVEGIGDNGNLPEGITLTNANSLSSPATIVESDKASNSLDIDLQYSQQVVQGDEIGYYRIDLKYTLSSV